MNILDPFIEHVKTDPDKPAIITNTEQITFEGLDQRSASLANHFQKQGLKTRDVALVVLPVGIELYVVLLALFRMGAVALFPDPSAGLKGVQKCLKVLEVIAFIGGTTLRWLRPFLPGLRSIPNSLSISYASSEAQNILALAPEHPALITFTSGSTGDPKGIIRSHEFLLRQHDMVSAVLRPAPADIDLISLPVFVLSNLASGVVSVIPAGDIRRPGSIDPVPVLEQVEQHGINRMLLPPAFCQRLVETKQELPQLTEIFTRGRPVFPNLLNDLADFAPNAKIVAAYGSTEAEPIAHIALSEISDEDKEDMKRGKGLLTGHPIDGIHVRILDDEIIVTGEHVVKGYLNPAHNASTKLEIDGKTWHRTGDAGRFDDQGRLWLLGRLEARQGELCPFSVETAARSINGVQQAAFIHHNQQDFLVLEMDGQNRSMIEHALRQRFPTITLVNAQIPLDKRHNSKVDYTRLRALLDAI